eukprot:CAMPEP_0184375124 /NCGR_PEP_ID=MMETSP1089-20130417/165390_1 /TAXON_ID=38269 ORGANISM="Gloeochaete wittrockiana, Strain SAG46.84" /NCGR_SAMPLE_ID=MMETSP1089 /ASSEMBLY_ACC=CAM_ASM_000445 /LENGTH=49 /DNA_ID=CAMNT_0026718175 /DNA_START=152 /DNA_END=301 /DNA_ORIENTATION=-
MRVFKSACGKVQYIHNPSRRSAIQWLEHRYTWEQADSKMSATERKATTE